MRVLHVHERARFQGGVEQIMHDLARGLGARGWRQALLCSDAGIDRGFSVPFDTVATDPQAAAAFAPDAILLHKWADQAVVEPLLARYPAVQVVHDHDLYCPRRHKYFPISHRVCTERAGVACVRHLCLLRRRAGLWPVGVSSLPAFRDRMAIAKRAGLFVAGSHYSAGELSRNGFASSRIEVIAPVPAAIAANAPSPPGQPGRMLFVGQVIRGKGLDLLMEAAARLRGDWRLDVVGEGRQLPECRRIVDRLGLASRVNFAGWVPHADLADWYRRASFTVVPSRWPEPFGMIGLESMAHGRPVVAFDSGGIRDWLPDGVAGLLVPAADVTRLAAALERVIGDPVFVARLGEAAGRHCRAAFSHDRYLDAMQSAIRSTADGAREARRPVP